MDWSNKAHKGEKTMIVLKKMGSWLGSIAIAFVLVVFLGVFIFQSTKVLGHSMDPTLHDTQKVYVSKLSHTFAQEPDYGDIVIIDSRVDQKRTLMNDLMDSPLLSLFLKADDRHVWIKRVIGKPGDTLEFKNHNVYRNGQALDEPYVKEQMVFESDKKWVVPDRHIWVMGDNRNNSSDSRVIGFIPLDHVLGKKVF
jgi:signal peptidase I